MIFTNAQKLYPLYVNVKHLILGATITEECLNELAEIISGTDKSKEITRNQLREEFRVCDDVEAY